jgi:hypothetical protein
MITPELATDIPLYCKQRSSNNVTKPYRRPQQQTKAYRIPTVQDRVTMDQLPKITLTGSMPTILF